MQANGEDINPTPDVLKKKKPWDPNVMYAKYNYENGPRSAFQHKFRTWWKTHFGQEASSVEHVHIKFTVKTNRTL
ncbi:unnamed protein product, partial [Rotaria magnacalcarata]